MLRCIFEECQCLIGSWQPLCTLEINGNNSSARFGQLQFSNIYSDMPSEKNLLFDQFKHMNSSGHPCAMNPLFFVL